MSWGKNYWGIDAWGTEPAVVTPTTHAISRIGVIAKDQILVVFNTPMRNNSALIDPLNYSLTVLGSGAAVNVISVLSGNKVNPRQISLIVTNFTPGSKYQVTVSQNVKTVAGDSLSISGSTGLFIGRRTKIDSFIESRPKMYDTRPTSLLRTILIAIGGEDDTLGGARKDYLP